MENQDNAEKEVESHSHKSTSWIEKIGAKWQSFNTGKDKEQDNSTVEKRQWKTLILLGGVAIGVLYAVTVVNNIANPKAVQQLQSRAVQPTVMIEDNLLSGEYIGQQHLEKRLDDQRTEQLTLQAENNKKLTELAEQLSNTLSALQIRIEQQDQQIALLQSREETIASQGSLRQFGVTEIDMLDGKESSLPKDIGIYIPATTHAQGRLLSGISVPTGINIQSNPMPVIIRITDDARLPKKLRSNLKDCQLVASCYGDLSSERVMLRVETLVCVDEHSRQSVETKVAGFVTGPDGVAGIRGKVVAMDKKYMESAIAGGILGGFARATKKGTEVTFNPLVGLPSEKPTTFGENLKNGVSEAAGDTLSKVADYYIKKAESLSPVIEVPAGAKIDVVFTEGVFFGQLNTKELIESQRSK